MKCKLFDIVFMPFLCIYVNTFLFFISQDPQASLEYIRIIAGAAAYRSLCLKPAAAGGDFIGHSRLSGSADCESAVYTGSKRDRLEDVSVKLI